MSIQLRELEKDLEKSFSRRWEEHARQELCFAHNLKLKMITRGTEAQWGKNSPHLVEQCQAQTCDVLTCLHSDTLGFLLRTKLDPSLHSTQFG